MDYRSRLTLGMVTVIFVVVTSMGSGFFQMSFGTYCFDCPGAQFHLGEAKKSIDSGNYDGAKNHIDQAKQLIGQSENSQSSNNSTNG